ncbi:MAG: hypothetical protein IH899_18020 [Planctomycetes bacterium]|nr:hypothetical protein [Planctomycetota bacterium]
MQNRQPRMRLRIRTLLLGTTAFVLTLLTVADQAHAIPTFSRKYRTSCITCHTVFPKLNDTGEAFRRNGYQFPSDEEFLVKDEPIPFGGDAYKDMFPESIWPSDMPTLPPVFVRAQLRNIVHTDPASDGIKWDMDFPHELVLGGAGTFGKNISAWWEVEWEPSEEEVAVERAFVQFSNLFAWSEEDDEDGMREANRWLALPKYAMNLRFGKMEPQVLPHIASQHARVSITQPLSIRQRIGGNRFRFEPVQSAAVELHGIVKQKYSYVVGYANGGNVSGAHLEDNNTKDVYFRVAKKWFGFPLDGVIEEPELNGEVGEANVRAQSPDEGFPEGEELDEEEFAPPGLDYWSAVGFETGFFSWWGESEVPFSGVTRNDAFRRIGFDARLQWHDLDIFGVFYWGHDEFAGLVNGMDLGEEDHFSYFVQADYMFKPWILGFVRYEQTNFNETARTTEEEARVIPGVAVVIRQNMKLQAEFVLDTSGKDTGGSQSTDAFLLQLDYVY